MELGSPAPPAALSPARRGRSASVTSASVVAKDETKFAEWSAGAGISLRTGTHDEPPIAARNLLTYLAKLDISAVIQQNGYLPSEPTPAYIPNLIALLREESTRRRGTESLTEKASEDLKGSLPVILFACRESRAARLSTVRSSEMSLRTSIDMIVNLVFDFDVSSYETLKEARLKMPKSTNHTYIGNVTIAETAAFSALVDYFHEKEVVAGDTPPAVCLTNPHYPHLHVLEFGLEHKATIEGQNQLIYYLSAAQIQRRSLGFTDLLVYGMTSSSNGVKVYVSSWETGVATPRVFIHEIGRFDLDGPMGWVLFYLFLRQISETAVETRQNFQSRSGAELATSIGLYGNPWHSGPPQTETDRPSKRSRSNGGNGGGIGSGGIGQMGPPPNPQTRGKDDEGHDNEWEEGSTMWTEEEDRTFSSDQTNFAESKLLMQKELGPPKDILTPCALDKLPTVPLDARCISFVEQTQ
ncbi:hypothetical protein BD410DRAFT_784327 [Rickenella mellea]|uniref:Uncharacterized protein n=1 Tax=Rickenella mellea TaxID=50990 RepID=A0A4Y7QFX0_9AGAM|nr:hypothetical protein BD410DRAFT_784327 [Rickenella mellea]